MTISSKEVEDFAWEVFTSDLVMSPEDLLTFKEGGFRELRIKRLLETLDQNLKDIEENQKKVDKCEKNRYSYRCSCGCPPQIVSNARVSI